MKIMKKYKIFYEDDAVGSIEVAQTDTLEEAKEWIALQKEDYYTGVPEEGARTGHYEVFDAEDWNRFVERFGTENLCPMDFIVHASRDFYVKV